MFAEAIEDILRDQCVPATVRSIESGGSPDQLWQALTGGGFLELLTPEDSGGAGLPLPELFSLLALFGRYAVPLPIGQAIVARGIVAPGVTLPVGLLTLAPALRRGPDGTISCPATPYGAIATHVLAEEDGKLLLLDASRAQRRAVKLLHSQVATLDWTDEDGVEEVEGNAKALPAHASALHAAMLAGAMARVFEMTLAYCNDRVQFGRSLGKFQAVQHQLSVMAELVVAATISAEAAFQNAGRAPRLLLAAMAKARASEAAVEVANAAHAMHGAIGVTEEYDLQLLTRRLHEWRMAHGSERYWNRIVGLSVLEGTGTLAEFVRIA
jgi:acyl-CoA dehydrogenase